MTALSLSMSQWLGILLLDALWGGHTHKGRGLPAVATTRAIHGHHG